MIDYALRNEKSKERIRKMKIGNKVDSDHHLEIGVESKGKTFKRKRKNKV